MCSKCGSCDVSLIKVTINSASRSASDKEERRREIDACNFLDVKTSLPSCSGMRHGSINQCMYIVALNGPRLTRRMIIWNKVSRNKSLPRQESFNRLHKITAALYIIIPNRRGFKRAMRNIVISQFRLLRITCYYSVQLEAIVFTVQKHLPLDHT